MDHQTGCVRQPDMPAVNNQRFSCRSSGTFGGTGQADHARCWRWLVAPLADCHPAVARGQNTRTYRSRCFPGSVTPKAHARPLTWWRGRGEGKISDCARHSTALHSVALARTKRRSVLVAAIDKSRIAVAPRQLGRDKASGVERWAECAKRKTISPSQLSKPCGSSSGRGCGASSAISVKSH